MNDGIGAIYYMNPEVLQGIYDFKFDIRIEELYYI